MKKCCAALARILVAASFLSAFISVFAQTKTAPQVLRRKTFEKVWRTINDKFFDSNFNGVDWKKVRQRFAPRAERVKTDAELYALLNEMLGELKVSHMGILTPDTLSKLKSPPTTTGLSVREIGNQVVVARIIENSSAAQAGIKRGFVVRKIDAEPVKTVEDALRKLAGAPSSNVRLSYLDEKDVPREAVLQRRFLDNIERSKIVGASSFYALFESKKLTDDIGYIRFSSFIAALNPKIETAIVSMKNAPGIIIDLRGNGGGDDDVAIRLAGFLFDKETQLMITKKRRGDDLYYKAKPQKNPYTGKIVILVDELSGSASEQFAAGMQEVGRATVIGKKTEGDDMDADLVELPTGAYLIYAAGEPRTPKGVVVEGRGVVPDIEVGLTRAGLLAGRDAQLEAAIERIKNCKR